MVTSLKSPGFDNATKTKCGFTVNGVSIDSDNLIVRQPVQKEPLRQASAPHD